MFVVLLHKSYRTVIQILSEIYQLHAVGGVATGGGYIGIYSPKIGLHGCSSPVTQDRFDMIYVHVWDIYMF